MAFLSGEPGIGKTSLCTTAGPVRPTSSASVCSTVDPTRTWGRATSPSPRHSPIWSCIADESLLARTRRRPWRCSSQPGARSGQAAPRHTTHPERRPRLRTGAPVRGGGEPAVVGLSRGRTSARHRRPALGRQGQLAAPSPLCASNAAAEGHGPRHLPGLGAVGRRPLVRHPGQHHAGRPTPSDSISSGWRTSRSSR